MQVRVRALQSGIVELERDWRPIGGAVGRPRPKLLERQPGERAALSLAEVVICWILITTIWSVLKLYNAHRAAYVIDTIKLSTLQKEIMHFVLSIT